MFTMITTAQASGRRFVNATIVTLLLAAHWASSEGAQAFPRTSVYLYKYSGTHSEEQRRAFEDFEDMLREKLISLSEEISQEITKKGLDADHFGRLRIDKVIDSQGNHLEFEGSLDDLHRKWQERGTLKLLTGRIRRDNAPFVAKSRIYLGALGDELGTRHITVRLSIDPDAFESAKDSYTATTLYALAIDARRFHNWELSHYLLQRAYVYVADIADSIEEMGLLRTKIEDALGQSR